MRTPKGRKNGEERRGEGRRKEGRGKKEGGRRREGDKEGEMRKDERTYAQITDKLTLMSTKPNSPGQLE